jgi:hypothetical protein
MYRKLLTLLFFSLVFFSVSQAQDPTFGKYGAIDRYVKRTPDSLANNIMELHQYLEAGAKNEQEKIRAFYFWIVRNITYKDKRELLFDEDLLFYMGSNNCSSPVCVLARKQAVCEGFSNLFQYFCSQSGFEAYSVGGYISKNGAFQDRATHSWNAVRVEGEWRFFDLSWANAYYAHTGMKSSTNEFFMVNPEEFIFTHLPMIPLWQFLHTPVPLSVFNTGDENISNHLEAAPIDYHYEDSLSVYMNLSPREKRLKTAEEIFKTNPANKFNLAMEYYRYARFALNYEGEITPLSYYRLIKAKEKIAITIDLLKSISDIGAQIMLLQAEEDLFRIEQRIEIGSKDIIYLK